MNSILTFAALLVVGNLNLNGQSYFEFWNHDVPAGVDAPVYDALGVPLAGTIYRPSFMAAPLLMN